MVGKIFLAVATVFAPRFVDWADAAASSTDPDPVPSLAP